MSIENFRALRRTAGGYGLVALLILVGGIRPAWSQQSEVRHHFLFKIGAAYDQGDFGGSETSRVLFTPVTLRYLGNRFDVSATPFFAAVDGPGGIRIIDGVPTSVGGGSDGRMAGMGDTIVRGRFRLYRESLSGYGLPSITPFLKVKLPTANQGLNLGTGETDYALGIEWDKQLPPVLLFGDVDFTLVGRAAGLNLRNRPGASFGVAGRVSRRMTVSGILDWRRSMVVGNPSLSELVGVVTYRLTPTVSLSPNAFVGLTENSSDFGTGVELAIRFGRY